MRTDGMHIAKIAATGKRPGKWSGKWPKRNQMRRLVLAHANKFQHGFDPGGISPGSALDLGAAPA